LPSNLDLILKEIPIKMKKAVLSILLLFSFFTAFSQSDKDLKKKIEKFIKSYPAWVSIPGTSFKTADSIITTSDFLMFRYEVSNIDWKEFIAYTLKEKGKAAADAFLPDSLLWLDLENYSDYAAFYYGRSNFNYFPVVNISYSQAEAYCKWLEDFYNSRENKFYKKVTVSLPTELEWIIAASGGSQGAVFSWPGYSVYGLKNEFQANFFEVNQANIFYGEGQSLQIGGKRNTYSWLNPAKNSPTAVTAYKANAYGLYNMSGNVAEFVKIDPANSSFTKGGGWGDPGYYLQIAKRQEYEIKKSASPFRGFRPILRMEF